MLAYSYKSEIITHVGELEDQLDRIVNQHQRRPEHRSRREFYTFHKYGRDRTVTIELTGEKIGDIAVEPDQLIEGRLVDQRQAVLLVTDATHQPALKDRRIILGMHRADLAGKPNSQNLRNCVAPGGTFSYYFPEEVGEITQFEVPASDSWYNLAAQYGRVAIDGKVIFDAINI